MSNLTKKNITDLLAVYELSHPVEEYKIKGLHVWPILRIRAAFDLYIKKENPNDEGKTDNIIKKVIRKLEQFFSIYSYWIKSCRCDLSEECQPGLKRDMVFLTHSSARRAIINGKFYDIFFDALLDVLPNRISTLSWELSSDNICRFPRYRPSVLISHRLIWTNLAARFHCLLFRNSKEPDWFNEYADWLVSLGASRVTYRDILVVVNELLYNATLFQRWLGRIRPKALFVNCWYSFICMAATLASKRMKIKTVDFQHGLQGDGHFAYASWKKSPSGGYEIMPDYFWVWGKMDAQSIRSTSDKVISPDKVVVGGYPWLSLWKNYQESPVYYSRFVHEAKCITDRKARSILVTLQGDESFDDLQELFQAIKEGHHDWQWLLRLHPRYLKDMDKIRSWAQKSNHLKINIEQASKLPLYALLKVVDIHITSWSTCALECIPFGVRTILIHENGREAFETFIRSGEMIFANGKDEIIHQITTSERFKSTSSDKEIFAGNEATIETFNKLLQMRINL